LFDERFSAAVVELKLQPVATVEVGCRAHRASVLAGEQPASPAEVARGYEGRQMRDGAVGVGQAVTSTGFEAVSFRRDPFAVTRVRTLDSGQSL
jgi:hypothetical protein